MTLGQIAKAMPIAQGLCVGSIFFIFLGSALGRREPELFMKQVVPFFFDRASADGHRVSEPV